MSPMNSWQGVFDQFLPYGDFKTCLEFGLGSGTEYLIKHFDKVISLEFLALPEHEKWYKECKEKFAQHDNWEVHLFRTKDKYTKKLRDYVDSFLKMKPDLVFVDPGIHCRALLVNQCFGIINTIVAHDTGTGHEDYRWDLLDPPSDYARHHFEVTQGTTMWTRNKKFYKSFLKGEK